MGYQAQCCYWHRGRTSNAGDYVLAVMRRNGGGASVTLRGGSGLFDCAEVGRIEAHFSDRSRSVYLHDARGWGVLWSVSCWWLCAWSRTWPNLPVYVPCGT